MFFSGIYGWTGGGIALSLVRTALGWKAARKAIQIAVHKDQ